MKTNVDRRRRTRRTAAPGGPFRFWGEVRAEGRKVTWATRQEVTVSTIMVLMMGVAAAIFFFLVDTCCRHLHPLGYL